MVLSVGKLITGAIEKASYQQGSDWESDQVRSANKRASIWQFVAYGALVVASLALLRWVNIPAETPSFPVLLMVDKATGNMEVMATSNERLLIEHQTLLDMHWAKKYVVHREGYYYQLLQDDYDMTLAMSSDDVGLQYAEEYSGNKAKDKTLGDRYEYRLDIKSVTAPPDRPGTAVVRYRRDKIQKASNRVEESEWLVSTFAFEYQLARVGKVNQLVENPLGFKVTAYRIDRELTSSKNMSARGEP